MAINWTDDIVSAVISTVLAIGISFAFYYKGNRNAFKQDVLEPIKNLIKGSQNYQTIVCQIQDKKNLYSYRYSTKKEREKLEDLEKACKQRIKYSYEKCFEESIWNYFYQTIGENRTHLVKNDYDEYEDLNYPDEYQADLKQYASWMNNEGEYTCSCEIKQQLLSFYDCFIKGDADVKRLLSGFDVNEVVTGSEEYKKYLDVLKDYEEKKKTFIEM